MPDFGIFTRSSHPFSCSNQCVTQIYRDFDSLFTSSSLSPPSPFSNRDRVPSQSGPGSFQSPPPPTNTWVTTRKFNPRPLHTHGLNTTRDIPFTGCSWSAHNYRHHSFLNTAQLSYHTPPHPCITLSPKNKRRTFHGPPGLHQRETGSPSLV